MPQPANGRASGGDPAARLVIVGTSEAALVCERALSALRRGPEALGVVLPPGERSYEGRLPVLGTPEDLPTLHARFGFGLALVSAPASGGPFVAEARAALEKLGVPVRLLPDLRETLGGGRTRSAAQAAPRATIGAPAREIDMLSLVGRTAHPIDDALVRRAIAGKRVLITGAGGSIGSEIARRVASYGPDFLALMERSENALFEIDRQIAARFPGLARQAMLHDVVEPEPTLRKLVAIRPDVVFHAAAHKHVPMMEDHPAAAVNNNVFGTKSIADASLAVGVERFVMISTDKAVNPSSVMGATKRMAELYVRSLNARSGGATRLCMVRFGNVLGSACSVLPIWSRQMVEGGPVTVTDPRMTRYFMTIPEAAALVIEAGALDAREANGADVFVLDMGEPVRIHDLALRFVSASGFAPETREKAGETRDGSVPTMRVVCTGARPGEKLHEELAHRSEELRATPAPGVLAWMGPPIGQQEVTRMIADLSAVRSSADDRAVLDTVARWTPGLRQAAAFSVMGPVESPNLESVGVA